MDTGDVDQLMEEHLMGEQEQQVQQEPQHEQHEPHDVAAVLNRITEITARIYAPAFKARVASGDPDTEAEKAALIAERNQLQSVRDSAFCLINVQLPRPPGCMNANHTKCERGLLTQLKPHLNFKYAANGLSEMFNAMFNAVLRGDAAPPPPAATISDPLSILSAATPRIYTTLPRGHPRFPQGGKVCAIWKEGGLPDLITPFHVPFNDAAITTRKGRCKQMVQQMQFSVDWRGGDFRDDLDTFLNHLHLGDEWQGELKYTQQQGRCTKGCRCGKVAERLQEEESKEREEEEAHRASAKMVKQVHKETTLQQLRTWTLEKCRTAVGTIMAGRFGKCAAHLDLAGMSFRQLTVSNGFKRCHGNKEHISGGKTEVSNLNQARNKLIKVMDEIYELDDNALVKGGFIAGLLPLLRKQFDFLASSVPGEQSILEKKAAQNDFSFQAILSSDGVPGLVASARNVAWVGLTVFMGQADVHSLKYIDFLAGGLMSESFAAYSYIVGDKLKADLKQVRENGFEYNGHTWTLNDKKYIVCNDLYGWWHCKNRMGKGTGNMQSKCSCIHCNSTGRQQKNITHHGVEYRRKEHAKLLEGKTIDGEDEIDYVSLFGFSREDVWEVFCTMHGGMRISDRHITCMLRLCKDVGGTEMYDAFVKLVKEMVTKRFSARAKLSADKKTTYKICGLPGPTAGKILGGMRNVILPRLFGPDSAFKESITKWEDEKGVADAQDVSN
jgi:hypothetical protein